jgi:peptidoglycan/LPS O-acetylase OafA/YrhL
VSLATSLPSARLRFYRPELDVLRFIAFLLVFFAHIGASQNRFVAAISATGQSGLCLFFLLSAYLITELLTREVDQTQHIDLKHFYIRRILRIWPIYFAALLLARLIDIHSAHPQMDAHRLLAYVLLAGNWNAYHHGLPASVVGILWSISVEEQFYLVWPWLQKHLQRRAILFAAVAMIPLSYIAISICAHFLVSDGQLWVNTFVQAQFFGLGCAIALLLRGRSPDWPSATRCFMFACGLGSLFAAHHFFPELLEHAIAWRSYAQYAFMALGVVFIFFSTLGYSALRNARVLISLGKISYGLYVFHILALRIMFHIVGLRIVLRAITWFRVHTAAPAWLFGFIHVISALGLTILLAHLSYRYFESFFLRLKERYAAVRSRPI